MALDINKLIEKAEDLVENPQLGFAAEIRSLIQEVTAPNGTIYQLQLLITCQESEMI